jgi:hypothetical protein
MHHPSCLWIQNHRPALQKGITEASITTTFTRSSSTNFTTPLSLTLDITRYPNTITQLNTAIQAVGIFDIFEIAQNIGLRLPTLDFDKARGEEENV